MARVMITCPETGKPIYTGMNFDWGPFESVQINEKAVPCHLCGETHVWRRKDAFLDEDGGES